MTAVEVQFMADLDRLLRDHAGRFYESTLTDCFLAVRIAKADFSGHFIQRVEEIWMQMEIFLTGLQISNRKTYSLLDSNQTEKNLFLLG